MRAPMLRAIVPWSPPAGTNVRSSPSMSSNRPSPPTAASSCAVMWRRSVLTDMERTLPTVLLVAADRAAAASAPAAHSGGPVSPLIRGALRGLRRDHVELQSPARSNPRRTLGNGPYVHSDPAAHGVVRAAGVLRAT